MANYNTIAEFEAALKRAKDSLGISIEMALRKSVPDLIEDIKKRVSTTGKKADGDNFSNYSAESVYSRTHTYRRKKSGNSGLGKQTEYRGFYYRGIMWNSFMPIGYNNTENKKNVRLGFVGQNIYRQNAQLNETHSKNEGIAIGMPNADEAKELTRRIGFEIGEYLKSVL